MQVLQEHTLPTEITTKKDEDHLPADLLRRHYQAARIEWLARNPR